MNNFKRISTKSLEGKKRRLNHCSYLLSWIKLIKSHCVTEILNSLWIRVWLWFSPSRGFLDIKRVHRISRLPVTISHLQAGANILLIICFYFRPDRRSGKSHMLASGWLMWLLLTQTCLSHLRFSLVPFFLLSPIALFTYTSCVELLADPCICLSFSESFLFLLLAYVSRFFMIQPTNALSYWKSALPFYLHISFSLYKTSFQIQYRISAVCSVWVSSARLWILGGQTCLYFSHFLYPNPAQLLSDRAMPIIAWWMNGFMMCL